jgi:hypothetical protein
MRLYMVCKNYNILYDFQIGKKTQLRCGTLCVYDIILDLDMSYEI